jgi:regulator of replication initiation timing
MSDYMAMKMDEQITGAISENEELRRENSQLREALKQAEEALRETELWGVLPHWTADKVKASLTTLAALAADHIADAGKEIDHVPDAGNDNG